MRLLLDTNIVLDVLLKRQPFFTDSREIWRLSDLGAIDASIASFSIPTIYYVCRKYAGANYADSAVDTCLNAFEICPLYRESILAARKLPGRDFEDNLQLACGITDFVEGLVTRNPLDFPSSPIRIYSPIELLKILK